MDHGIIRTIGACLLLLMMVPIGARDLQSQNKKVAIVGKLLGQDGAAMKSSYLEIDRKGKGYKVNPHRDGTFACDLDDIGAYSIWCSGVQHQTLTFPLLCEKPDRIELTITLKGIEYTPPFDKIAVIGDFNGFERGAGAITLAREPDGTYRASVPSKGTELRYQLIGVQKGGWPVEGMQADAYEKSKDNVVFAGRGGFFCSVIKADGTVATIEFDPRTLPAARNARPEVRFANPDQVAAQICATYFELENLERAGALEKVLAERISSEKRQLVRQYLLLRYFQMFPESHNQILARTALKEALPTSYVWSLPFGGTGNLFNRIARIADDSVLSTNALKEIAAKNPDQNVRAEFASILQHQK